MRESWMMAAGSPADQLSVALALDCCWALPTPELNGAVGPCVTLSGSGHLMVCGQRAL